MADSLYVDPISGGYLKENNRLIRRRSTITKANILLAQRINKYIYSPQEGNPLIGTTGILSENQISEGINSCLAPLVNNGDILAVTIDNSRYNSVTQRYFIQISLIFPNGEKEPISFIRK